MKFLIIFYDNALIYYPNIFFAALFLFLFLIVVFLFQTVVYISTLEFIGKAKSHGYLLKPRKVNIGNYPIIVAKKFIDASINWLGQIEIRIEKIIKRIGKEILIDEKN